MGNCVDALASVDRPSKYILSKRAVSKSQTIHPFPRYVYSQSRALEATCRQYSTQSIKYHVNRQISHAYAGEQERSYCTSPSGMLVAIKPQESNQKLTRFQSQNPDANKNHITLPAPHRFPFSTLPASLTVLINLSTSPNALSIFSPSFPRP